MGADPIPWLLEGDDPSVRYFTLSELLGAEPDNPDVVAARRAIMSHGTVPRILAAQAGNGHWEGADYYYAAKYRGTVWQLIILAALGADGADERVRAGCEAILRDAQDTESGGFAVGRAKKAGGGLHSSVIPCLTGNLVWSLIRLGMRATRECNAASSGSPPTNASTTAWARHRPAGHTTGGRCAGGVTPATWARSRRSRHWPRSRRSVRSPEVERTLAQGAEFMLRHHVHKRSHDLAQVSKPGWQRLWIGERCGRLLAGFRGGAGDATSTRSRIAPG